MKVCEGYHHKSPVLVYDRKFVAGIVCTSLEANDHLLPSTTLFVPVVLVVYIPAPLAVIFL